MELAKKHLDLGLTISRRIKDRRNEAVALKALGDWAWQAGDMDAARSYYEESFPIRQECRDLRGEAIILKVLGDLALQVGNRTSTRDHLNRSLTLFREIKDQRGEGIALHSFAILALEEGERAIVQNYLNQSLSLLRSVQDRQSEAAVLYAFALWAEIRGDLTQAEEYFRQSVQIATEIKTVYNLAVFQETLGDFLIRRAGQRGKNEGDFLLVQAAETYRRIERDEDARHVEERRIGRYRIRERDKIVRALIYDLDEGPNGQSFAVPNERRSARCSSQMFT
jgi:tetratricopeptide (TPR) repeat protein